jgi:hypothetical protein
MRRTAVIAGVLILATAFVAAWLVLGPTSAEQRGRHFTEGAVSANPTGSPLEPGATTGHCGAPLGNGCKPATADAPADVRPEPGQTRPGDSRTVEAGNLLSGEAPQPGTTPAAGKPITPPDETAGAETPGPPPPPFIKGHDRPPGQNLGNTRPGARVIAKPTGVKSLDDVTPKLMQDRRGLYAEYFQFEFGKAEQLELQPPGLVRIDRQVYFPDEGSFKELPFSLSQFAATWEGYLVIREHGDYWLFWGADSGGRVELDGQTVLLQDGMIRYVEVSAVLTLSPGLHPLRIEFAQTKSTAADWAKCAANFMWVPQGETKPVAVPPEMLMVPEWMWSDNAPIITSLSKYEGEIGDEITIHGQGLFVEEGQAAQGYSGTEVRFAGQLATLVEAAATELRVKVPIGAVTGDVIVFRRSHSSDNLLPRVPFDAKPAIPSTSVEFKVTTLFGLVAEWHNLEGWSNFGYEVFEATEPTLTQLEPDAGRANAPSGYEVGAVRWDGRIGVPEKAPAVGTPPDQLANMLVLWTAAPGRVRVGTQTIELLFVEELDGQRRHCALFTLDDTPPCMLELSIELLCQQPIEVPRWRFEYRTQDGEVNGSGLEQGNRHILWRQHFFPPAAPPKPPEISEVKAVIGEGEQPTTPPYDVDPSRPSVRVGQEFTFDVTDYGPDGLWSSHPIVTIDGVLLDYVVLKINAADSTDDGGDLRVLDCRAVMPEGVGEGRLVARLSVVTSEPVFIDIANRGLVAYLFDVPDAGGLAKLPDLGPLQCFKVRKDRVINFESAASFDLPFPAETFVIEWLGGLIIEEEADYTFTCRSDDGMKLWLDDNVVLDADKLQAPAENSATVHLVPGTYRFRMQFFENNQHEVCVLEWAASRGEGASLEAVIPRAVIPANAFTLDVHPPFPAKTSTGKRTDGS